MVSVAVCRTCKRKGDNPNHTAKCEDRATAEMEARSHKEWNPRHHVYVDGDRLYMREGRAFVKRGEK